MRSINPPSAVIRSILCLGLEGKIAVITGGSSGIEAGDRQAVLSARAHTFSSPVAASPNLPKAKAEIGKNVSTVQGDVSSLADLDRLYATVKAEKGVIDILVANAGFVEHAKIFDLSEAHCARDHGHQRQGCCLYGAESSAAHGPGRFDRRCLFDRQREGYSRAWHLYRRKAAVRGLVRVWAQELKEKGIRVNTLSPGATDTPIIRGQFDSDEASEAAKGVFASDDTAWPARAFGGTRSRRVFPGIRRVVLRHRHRPAH